MKKVICIYGPTAVGKSKVAVELAKLIDGEIISADSMQIYKGLDIGSAKVTTDEMQGIPHYLIDIKMPNENYSVAEFVKDANLLIEDILKRNKTPIIVGGTGLYFKGLLDGYDFGNTERNTKLREELDKLSLDQLYNRLITIEPNTNIDKNNKHRIIRAIEVAESGSKKSSNSKFIYEYKLIGIVDDRQKIYERINSRVDCMISDGLLNELKYLMGLNLGNDALCMKAIGYKELIPFMNGEKSLNECKEILKQKTRNYAKRQFTFINQFKDITLVNFDGVKSTAKKIVEMYEDKNG